MVNLVCNFNLQHYPFDTQYCHFTKVMDETSMEFVVLKPIEVSFIGKRILAEYKVTRLVSRSDNRSGYSGQQVIIEFKNMYVLYITSAFIPTLLLIFISYLTFWFSVENFSDRIMVSLTSLLVLAALYNQISSSLPNTSYLKLIDVWFLICIIFDFIMIVWLVLIDRYITKVSAYKTKCVKFYEMFNSNLLNKLAQIILIVLMILFVMVYFTYIAIYNENHPAFTEL